MKRNLAFLLTLVLCVGLLVSCSDGKTNNNDDGSPSSNITDNSAKDSSSDDIILEDVFGNILDSINENDLPTEGEPQEDLATEDYPQEDVAYEDDSQVDYITEGVLIEENKFAELFTNYSCEIHTIQADTETYIIKYKVHPDGVWFSTDMNDDSIFIHDIKNSKLYILNESDKSGMVMDASDMSSGFTQPADYFMAWASMTSGTLEKGSSDVVDGRSATIFYYKVGESEVRFYIDDEMGFCLAYEIIYEGNLDTRWEIKNFQVGKVTIEDIKAPSDYTLIEIPAD